MQEKCHMGFLLPMKEDSITSLAWMDDTAGRLARQNYSVSLPQVLVSCISIISLFEIFSAAAAAKSLQLCPTL